MNETATETPTIFNGAYRFTMDDVYKNGVERTVLALLRQVEFDAREAIAKHEASTALATGGITTRHVRDYVSQHAKTKFCDEIKLNG